MIYNYDISFDGKHLTTISIVAKDEKDALESVISDVEGRVEIERVSKEEEMDRRAEFRGER